MSSGIPVVFGEVLFDHFPDGTRVLGGAPFNVAWHLQGFGKRPLFISRVGTDPEGYDVLERMRGWGMRTDGVQRDPSCSTGRVTVRIVHDEPAYTIDHPSAWDRIEPVAPPVRASVLYHGTLALRSARSRESLAELRRQLAAPVFVDVNLRDPWWEREQVLRDVRDAHTVKLNAQELDRVGGGDAEAFRQQQGIRRLVLTHGAHGASLVDAQPPTSVKPEPTDSIVDTVGAGDAFASVVLLGTLEGWSRRDTLMRAQDFASIVVQQRGATRDDPAPYRELQNRWKTPALG